MDCKKGSCKENKKPNSGVVCDVTHCSYNNGHCQCTASQISIGPHSACCCSDTVCATFQEKKDTLQ